jgi:acyl-CoA synthetase (AMP-forming)/AMP-acid ligase II
VATRLHAGGVRSAPADSSEAINIGGLLSDFAARQPDRAAVMVAKGLGSKFNIRGPSYAQLDADSNRIARGLRDRGLNVGDRVCLFVRPGVELIAITFALMKAGAVPVLIDPGMGRKSMLSCVERMQPRAFIGIPLAHALKRVFPRVFRTVELSVTVGTRWFWGGTTLAELLQTRDDSRFVEEMTSTQEAAILFTSGSTGPAKGVTYTHSTFGAQIRALRELYDFQDGEVDAACFPLFALFSPGLELTCVFPEMDPSKPASCDPERIVESIQRAEATSTFGSPAIWQRVVPWCIERSVKLPSLRRVLIAGAPVSPELVAGFHKVLVGDADVHTPYGATESLPVSSISGREILERAQQTAGRAVGTCVGKPAAGIDLQLIRIDDSAQREWSSKRIVPAGEMGEICVRGDVVTREYKFQEEQTDLAKIGTGKELRHRIGDVGYFDAQGNLWFCGRKSHRLETAAGLVMPVPTEVLFNSTPRVHRTALVGVGERGMERPVLIVEPERGALPMSEKMRQKFIEELRAHVQGMSGVAPIEHFLFHPSFPVDVRHNAKIHRGDLKRWAEEQLA